MRSRPAAICSRRSTTCPGSRAPYTPPARPDAPRGPPANPAEVATTLIRRSVAAALRDPLLSSLLSVPALCQLPDILRIHDLLDRKIELSRGNYFLKSGLTFQAMTRKPDWYKFATTRDLIEGLSDPSTEGSERNEVAMFVHGRILRPFLGINLLVHEPALVLGGYGRNAFINLGFALGNSAMFYGAIILCQYLGSFGVFSPPMSAWAPLFVFGTIATMRWGQIRT